MLDCLFNTYHKGNKIFECRHILQAKTALKILNCIKFQTENGVPSSRPTSSAYASASASASGSTPGSSASSSAKQTLSNLKTAFTKKMAFANASLRIPKKSSRSQDHAGDIHAGRQNDASMETASAASSDSATVAEASPGGLADETESLDDEASGRTSAASQYVQRLSASNDNLTDIPERYQQVAFTLKKFFSQHQALNQSNLRINLIRACQQ